MRSTTKLDNKADAESSILEHLDDLVSVVDSNYRYRAVSGGYCQFFGLSADQIVGKHVAELHGQDIFEQKLKQGLDQTLAGENCHLRFWRNNHLGEKRFLDSKHTPYHGPLTQGSGIAIVARDVTELILSQQALETEKSLLRTIINAVPDIIFIKDTDGAYQLCNTSFEEFLGKTSDEILGKTDQKLMSEASARYISDRDNEVTATQTAKRCDEWVAYNDGRKRLLDMYKLPLTDSTNSPSGLLGIGRNVTFEREAEQKLLMSALLFETTPDACLILSEDGTIISLNSAATTKFSTLLANKTNPTFSELFYWPGKQSTAINQILKQIKSWQGEICTTDHNAYIATISCITKSTDSLTKYVVIIRDENDQRAVTRELMAKAYRDPLTNLPNRLLFQSRLESAITRSERQFRKVAVLFIDLDKFKPVNDQFGHIVGDQLLRLIAERLTTSLRQTDTLARIGGDEFVALIDISKREGAGRVAEKISNSLKQPFMINNTQVHIGASIGISIFPDDTSTSEELLQKADEAMYLAKKQPDKSYIYYKKN